MRRRRVFAFSAGHPKFPSILSAVAPLYGPCHSLTSARPTPVAQSLLLGLSREETVLLASPLRHQPTYLRVPHPTRLPAKGGPLRSYASRYPERSLRSEVLFSIARFLCDESLLPFSSLRVSASSAPLRYLFTWVCFWTPRSPDRLTPGFFLSAFK